MTCPHCASATTKEQAQKTALGYRPFRCSACKRLFNERTGTPFNFLENSTDIVLLVVLWRLRYKLSLRDLAEMFLERGWEFTHEAVREWKTRFAPLMTVRYYPMHGFGSFDSVACFCCAFDELCNYFCPRATAGEPVSLSDQRQLFCERLTALQLMMRMAS
ncbi:hypothetical protein [Ktedonospora formicarum]|uniref:hypothetical protein n=1 Tax=Ktedonospora formicarum TaxID=2778364 RepID=UPI001C68F191|nr:hypothetical protein [Ktedonospora formicarum]